MKIAMALAVMACVACKDKTEKKPAPPPQGTPQGAAARPAERPTLEVTDVKGAGVLPAVGLGPKVTMTKTALEIDGETVVTFGPDGLIDKTRLEAMTRILENKATSDAPVAITLDATTSYRRVGQLVDTLRRAGFRNLALLTGTGATMIPIELPDSTEVNRGGLRPVVTLHHKRLTLWSASGEEGTKTAPKLALSLGDTPSFEPVTRALAEIVQKRWPDGRRAEEDRTIIIQLDGNQPAQTLLQLLASVRAHGSLELFPNIFLAGGV